MDRKQLEEKLNQLKSAASLKLDEAAKALGEDRYDDAANLRKDAQEYIGKADAVKAQIEMVDKASEMKVASKEAGRLPFETATPEAAKPAEDPNKSVYVLRYGEVDGSVKAAINDIYGSNYNEMRDTQNRAFVKYIRGGFEKLTAKEADLLRTLIYTPEHVMGEIKAGYSVAEIQANKTDQQETSLELGGALVPADVRSEIIKRMMGMTIVRQRARVVETVRDAVEWAKLEGGTSQYTSAVRVTWVNEIPASATTAQTNFTVGTLRIPVHTTMARTDVSRNLLEDAGVNIPALIAELFAEAFAIDEDTQFLTGVGGGRPKGVLGERANGAQESPVDGVAAVASGAAAALTADGLIDLVYNLDAQYLRGAVLVGRKATFASIRKLKDGDGDYLWQKGIEAGAPPTVLGYPYYMNESIPAVAANAHALVFGDWRGYLIADRVGLAIERTTDSTLTGQNKVALFGRRRVGGQVIMPWMFAAQKIAAS